MKENGSSLVVRHLIKGWQDTVPYVTDYLLAEEAPWLLLSSSGRDSSFEAGVYLYDLGKRPGPSLAHQRS